MRSAAAQENARAELLACAAAEGAAAGEGAEGAAEATMSETPPLSPRHGAAAEAAEAARSAAEAAAHGFGAAVAELTVEGAGGAAACAAVRVPLYAGENVIGRAPRASDDAASAIVDVGAMSRTHCVVTVGVPPSDGGETPRVWLRDFCSTHGTFLPTTGGHARLAAGHPVTWAEGEVAMLADARCTYALLPGRVAAIATLPATATLPPTDVDADAGADGADAGADAARGEEFDAAVLGSLGGEGFDAAALGSLGGGADSDDDATTDNPDEAAAAGTQVDGTTDTAAGPPPAEPHSPPLDSQPMGADDTDEPVAMATELDARLAVEVPHSEAVVEPSSNQPPPMPTPGATPLGPTIDYDCNVDAVARAGGDAAPTIANTAEDAGQGTAVATAATFDAAVVAVADATPAVDSEGQAARASPTGEANNASAAVHAAPDEDANVPDVPGASDNSGDIQIDDAETQMDAEVQGDATTQQTDVYLTAPTPGKREPALAHSPERDPEGRAAAEPSSLPAAEGAAEGLVKAGTGGEGPSHQQIADAEAPSLGDGTAQVTQLELEGEDTQLPTANTQAAAATLACEIGGGQPSAAVETPATDSVGAAGGDAGESAGLPVAERVVAGTFSGLTGIRSGSIDAFRMDSAGGMSQQLPVGSRPSLASLPPDSQQLAAVLHGNVGELLQQMNGEAGSVSAQATQLTHSQAGREVINAEAVTDEGGTGTAEEAPKGTEPGGEEAAPAEEPAAEEPAANEPVAEEAAPEAVHAEEAAPAEEEVAPAEEEAAPAEEEAAPAEEGALVEEEAVPPRAVAEGDPEEGGLGQATSATHMRGGRRTRGPAISSAVVESEARTPAARSARKRGRGSNACDVEDTPPSSKRTKAKVGASSRLKVVLADGVLGGKASWPKLEGFVQKLSGTRVDDVAQASVLVTDDLKRSEKTAIAFAAGVPIVASSWLSASAAAGGQLQCNDYPPPNTRKFERAQGVDLQLSLSEARRRPLLSNRRVFATKSCWGGKLDWRAIVRAAGGEPLKTMPRSDDALVLTCDADAQLRASARFALYEQDLLLDVIFKQRLDDVGKFEVPQKGSSGRSARRR